jgi:hypothetical protein
MVRPGRELLLGLVEVDEGYVDGRGVGVDGRQIEDKAIVVVAVEVGPGRRESAGQARTPRVERPTKDALEDSDLGAVAPGERVRTDGRSGYGLPRLSVAGAPINISATGDPASVRMPHVHRVLGLLKRWLLGTHQGAVQPHQVAYYLDVFTSASTAAAPAPRALLRPVRRGRRHRPHPAQQFVGGGGGRNGTDHNI